MPKNLGIATTWLAAALILAHPISAGAATLTTLFSFDGSYGSFLTGSLIADASGNLYGTASSGGKYNYGDVFELQPPAAGRTAWTSKVLVSFNRADGGGPQGSLIADRVGNLYGTTAGGGKYNYGCVFELSPPAAGKSAWKEEVLFSFSGVATGLAPLAGVILDKSGNLYGTTERGGTNHAGTVFELSPPAAGKNAWTERILFEFYQSHGALPLSPLIADVAGNLYGTTDRGGKGYGTVFELSPPTIGQIAWTEKVLFAFNRTDGDGPQGGLVADGAGNLYGTTAGGAGKGYGTVFELSPPAPGKTAWTEKVLASFDGINGEFPVGGLIADKAGDLYGTTSHGGKGFGILFELSPPAPEKAAWAETILASFNDGEYPLGGLIADDAGTLYGTTSSGGKYNGGTVFEVSP